MNRLTISLALSLFAMGASAQTVAVDVSKPDQSKPNEVTHIVADNDKFIDRKCLRQTGSHIVRHKDKRGCMDVIGSSYSQEDLERTGAVDIGQALRLLDPAIR